MNLREELIQSLIAAKIPSPRLETDIILKYAAPHYPNISEAEKKTLQDFLARRINHEPLDKIIGYREFYKYRFKVSADVLTPRPDTEILVEKALFLLSTDATSRILDLGTGSGCILLSLLKERSSAKGVGIDKSAAALKIASKNAQELGIENRITFINKSWNEIDWGYEKFDMIVSNPPYIPSAEIETLDTEVKNYDPIMALDGGKTGLDCYNEIAKIAPEIMSDNAYILLEVGYNQAEEVAKIFQNANLKLIEIVKDLAGINRCVILKKIR
mgnify:CR=1 FL=1